MTVTKKTTIQRYRYPLIVISEVTRTDFKLRYHGSILGYLWSILRPMALFSILYIIFAKVFKVGDAIPHYPVYLLTGIVLWTFFSEITTGGITSIADKGDLMRKINFPKYTIIVSKSISAAINLAINFSVIFVFMMLTGASPSPLALVVVPLMLLQLFVFSLGVVFILSTLYVRFRDIIYVWEVAMQALFYATPLLYPINLVVNNFSPWIAKIMLLNPIAQIVQDIRVVMVTPKALSFEALYGNGAWRVVPVLLTGLALVVGIVFFRKRQAMFAEEA